ncbi:MAG TPA: hypothetical protein VJ781_12885 [Pyrinomonadaceae bacterium]|nr:hypothetical protein [Pyrinomonadaceae bacterium]
MVRFFLNTPTNPSVFYVDIPPPLETEAGERDLSQYEYGGEIKNCAAIIYGEEDEAKGQRCLAELEKARSFIQEHFEKHQLGYVIIDSPHINTTGRNYFFIEPDGTGEDWEIRIRGRVPGPYTRFNRNVNTWYYTEVFRRRIEEDDGYIEAGTSALVLRSRGVYELIL